MKEAAAMLDGGGFEMVCFLLTKPKLIGPGC